MKKVFSIFFIFLFIFSFISFSSAVTTIEVQQPPAPSNEGWFDKYVGWWLLSPLFWGFVVLLLLIGVLVTIIIIGIQYAMKYFKAQNSLFYKLKLERLKLTKVHNPYPSSNHWWSIKKNIPIKLFKVENGKPKISDPIGYFSGSYTSHEGNLLMSLYMEGLKKFFILPEKQLLVIPNGQTINMRFKRQLNDKGSDIVTVKLPKAKDIVQFGEKEILLFCESISFSGREEDKILIPVINDIDGYNIDLSIPIFDMLKNVAVTNYLYEQTTEFTITNKQSISMNPNIKSQQMVTDKNKNVDLQTTGN
jgi:hypothetical protein